MPRIQVIRKPKQEGFKVPASLDYRVNLRSYNETLYLKKKLLFSVFYILLKFL